MSETKIQFIAKYMETLNLLSNKMAGYRKEYLDLELLIQTMPDCSERTELINTVIDMRLKEISMEANINDNLLSLAKVMSQAEDFYIKSENEEFEKLADSTCDRIKEYYKMESKKMYKAEDVIEIVKNLTLESRIKLLNFLADTIIKDIPKFKDVWENSKDHVISNLNQESTAGHDCGQSCGGGASIVWDYYHKSTLEPKKLYALAMNSCLAGSIGSAAFYYASSLDNGALCKFIEGLQKGE